MTSLFSRLQKLNKEATEPRWEVADSEIISVARENRRGPDDFIADVGEETEADSLVNAALIVECRNSLPAVLNLIEAAERMVNPDYDGWKAIEAHEALAEAVAVFVSGQEEPSEGGAG